MHNVKIHTEEDVSTAFNTDMKVQDYDSKFPHFQSIIKTTRLGREVDAGCWPIKTIRHIIP